MLASSQITFTRNSLMNALRYANFILEKAGNSFMQITSSNNNAANNLVLTFSDNIGSFQQIVTCVHADISQPMYVDRELLHNLLRTLKSDDEITIIDNDKSILVSYNNGQKTFAKAQEPTYISLPEVSGAHLHFRYNDLISKLKYVKHAVSADDIRHQFRGVSLSIKNGMLAIWASDGYKFAMIEEAAPDLQEDIRCILPKKLIDAICAIEVDAPVIMTISQTNVHVSIASIIIVMPLIDAVPFDYTPIMKFKNEEPLISITGDSSSLVHSIERAVVGCDEQGWINVDVGSQPKLITNNIITNSYGCEILDMNMMRMHGTGSFYINAQTMIGFLKQLKGEVCIRHYPNSKTITITPNYQHDGLMLYLTRTISRR